MEYGFINEDGYLMSKHLEDIELRRKKEDGTIEVYTKTVQDQISELDDSWKPVDQLDDTFMVCNENNYYVKPMPFDNGDKISFKYIKVYDVNKIKREIQQNKNLLSSTDYKVTKCYEASLIGEALPYDMSALHVEREAIRANINELEVLLNEPV